MAPRFCSVTPVTPAAANVEGVGTGPEPSNRLSSVSAGVRVTVTV